MREGVKPGKPLPGAGGTLKGIPVHGRAVVRSVDRIGPGRYGVRPGNRVHDLPGHPSPGRGFRLSVALGREPALAPAPGCPEPRTRFNLVDVQRQLYGGGGCATGNGTRSRIDQRTGDCLPHLSSPQSQKSPQVPSCGLFAFQRGNRRRGHGSRTARR